MLQISRNWPNFAGSVSAAQSGVTPPSLACLRALSALTLLFAAAAVLSACGEVAIAPVSGGNNTSTDGAATDAAVADTAADGNGVDSTAADTGTGDAGNDMAGNDTAGNDTAGNDTAGNDTATNDSAGDTATNDSAGDTTTGPVVTGQGLFTFESEPGPANFRLPTLYMFQTTAPPSGHAYVLWQQKAGGGLTHSGILPYEDVPYKADFTVKLPPPTAAGEEPIEAIFGATITLESELDAAIAAAPKGPVVYEGHHAPAAWVHIVHVLTAKSPGQTGYLQDADAIVANVEKHRVAALDCVSDPTKCAAIQVEFAHNALVGKAKAVDINGDTKVDFDAPIATGLVAPETALNHAVKHAVFARDGDKNAPDDGPLKGGVLALQSAAATTNDAVADAKSKTFAFAKGVTTNFKDADLALQAVRSGMNAALSAGRKLGSVTLVPQP